MAEDILRAARLRRERLLNAARTSYNLGEISLEEYERKIDAIEYQYRRVVNDTLEK